jgi:hypothetical protein
MSRHVRATPIEPPKLTLNGCIAIACNEANLRMRQAGRKEWDDSDYAVSVRILCRYLRQIGEPYLEIADRMEASGVKPPL